MKVKIKDLDGFTRSVFGADAFIEHFPELLTTGVTIEPEEVRGQEWYFVVNPETGKKYDVTAFFSKEELQYLTAMI